MAIDTGMTGGESTGLRVVIDPAAAKQGADVVNRALDSMPDHAENATSKIAKSFSSLKSQLFGLRSGLTGIGVGLFASEVLRAETTMAKLMNTLRTSTGSALMAKVTFEQIRKVSNEMAIDLGTAAHGFARLQAAMVGTGMPNGTTEKLFKGVAAAVTATGGGAYELYLALKAVEQMASKGRVQMEELRGQLGDVLPGAFNIVAKAMGLTTGELNRMMKAGLSAKEVLPKLADELQRRFTDAAKEAGNSVVGVINRWRTFKLELLHEVGLGGFTVGLGKAVDNLREKLLTPEFREAAHNIGSLFGTAIIKVSDALVYLATHLDQVKAALFAFASFKIIVFFTELVTLVNRLREALIGLGVAQAVVNAQGLFGGKGAAGAAVGSAVGVAGGSGAKDIVQALLAMKGGEAVLSKTGKVLSQTAFNAKLAGKGFEEMGVGSRLAVREAANLAGLKLGSDFLKAGIWVSLTNLVKGATSAFTKLGTVILSAGRGLLSLAVANPWTALIAAIVIITTLLLAFRNHLITIEGHTARLKDYFYDLWDVIGGKSVFDHIGKAITYIKNASGSIFDGFKESFKKAVDYISSITPDWLKKVLAVPGQIVGGIAASAEARLNIEKAGRMPGYVDPITLKKRTMPDPGGLALTSQLAIRNEETPDDLKIPKEDPVRKLIEKLKAEGVGLDKMIKAMVTGSDTVLTKGDGIIRQMEAETRAMEEIASLGMKLSKSDPRLKEIIDINKSNAQKKLFVDAADALGKMAETTQEEIDKQTALNGAIEKGTFALDRVKADYEDQLALKKILNTLTADEQNKLKPVIDRLKERLKISRDLTYEEKVRTAVQQANMEVPSVSLHSQLSDIEVMKEYGLTAEAAWIKATRAIDEYNSAQDFVLMRTRQGAAGAQVFFRQYAEAARDAAHQVYEIFSGVFRNIEDLFVDILGNRSPRFKEMLEQLRDDLNRAKIQQNITGPLADKLGGLIPGVNIGGINRPTGAKNNPLNVWVLNPSNDSGGGSNLGNNPADLGKVGQLDGKKVFGSMADNIAAAIKQMKLAKYQLAQLQTQLSEFKIDQGKGGFKDVIKVTIGSYIKDFQGFNKTVISMFKQTFNTLADGAANALSRALVYGEDLGAALKDVAREAIAGLISGFIKLGIQMLITFVLGKTLAASALAATIAEASAAAAAWAPAAAFASLATLGSNAAPASGALIGTVALAEILGQVGSKFALGGIVPGTGNQDSVHALLTPGEGVLTRQAVAYLGVNTVNALNRGARVNTSTSVPNYGNMGGQRPVEIKVEHDGSTYVAVEQLSEGKVKIIAKQEAQKVVEQHSAPIISGELNDPNSRVSQAMRRNYAVPRKR
jgi:tape measure domain-containing protein